MRVAVEDCGESGGGGVEMQCTEVVKQVEVVAFDQEDFGLREASAGAIACRRCRERR